MANASLDTLTIKINADSKQANNSIRSLTNNLQKLDDTAKNINTRRIGEIRGLLLHIAKIDFTNVSKGLQDVVSAFKLLQTTALSKNFSGLNGSSPLQNFDFSKFANFKPKIKSNDLVSSLIKDTNLLSQAYDSATASVERFGQATNNAVGTSSKLMSDFNSQLKENKEIIEGATKNIGTMFARILRYRVVRKIIQLLYQALSESINRIAQFDEATNRALSEIKTSFSYLTSSIGSALAPLIKAITPILTKVIDLVADLINSLGVLFAIFTGNEIIKATKEWEDFNNALKDTKTVGIDELNVIGEATRTYYIKVEGADKLQEVLSSAEKLGIAIGVIGSLSSVWGVLKTGILAVNLASLKLKATLSVGVLGGLIAIASGIMDIVENGVNAQNVLAVVIGTLATAVSGFFLMLNTKVGSAIIAISGLRTALLSIGIAMGTLTAGVLLFATAFQKVKEGWGNMNFWQKLATSIGLIIIAVATLVATVSAFLQQWHVFGIAVLSMGVGAGITFGTLSSVPQFATGGFPEDGVFMANHSELVGKFSNGKTAVANNQEITQGIYEAVRDAMKESSGNAITIEMDGYKVAKGVTKRQNNFGEQTLFGGNINYGK